MKISKNIQEPAMPAANAITAETQSENIAVKILLACGIKTVIWIDDEFSKNSNDPIGELEKYVRIFLSNQAVPDFLSKIRASNPNDDDYFNRVQEEINSNKETLSLLSQFNIEARKEDKDGEFSEETRNQIKNILHPIDVKTYSNAEWTKNAETHLREQHGILYFVDDNYHLESIGENHGRENIIPNILGMKNDAYCILLTKSLSPEYEQKPLKAGERESPYLVISKKSFEESRENAERFSLRIRKAVSHLCTMKMIEKIHSKYTNNIKEGMDSIKELTIHQLEHLLFARPAQEGASELETVMRLLSTTGELKLMDKEAVAHANSVRRIRKIHASKEMDKSAEPSEFIEKLTESHFFIPGEFINKQFCQISNGDVIQLKEPKSGQDSLAVIVWQPCDLILRDDKGRQTKTAWLIPYGVMKKEDVSASKISSGKIFPLSLGSNQEKCYAFKLDKARMINLDVFDLVSTNETGDVKFSTASTAPENTLPNEFIRYKKVLKDVVAAANNGLILFWGCKEAPSKCNPKDPTKTIDFKMSRIKRLRENYAQEVLRAMCAMISRPGFPHVIADLQGDEDNKKEDEHQDPCGPEQP